MVPRGGPDVLKKSPPASGIFFQEEEEQSLKPANSGRSNTGPPSGEMNQGILSSTANSSGPSVGTSSMVTDGNSSFSGGRQLQRSASINTDSYRFLPASPLSFSSNNISGSSIMDGSNIMQHSSYNDQIQKQGTSSATSNLAFQDPVNTMQPQKKPRLDGNHGKIMQPQAFQQILQRHDSQQVNTHQNPQMQLLIQQKLLQQRHQQQMLQSFAPLQRAHIQQQDIRQQLQQQTLHMGSYIKRPFDSGICARLLMQYMYHMRHRPPENSIHYWRKFVAEYFTPQAKKRWCLSSYDNIGNQAFGVFPQSATDGWHCDICGSQSGKGFEATFEVIPRLLKINFDSGIIDELLFLDMPHECRLPSGIMLLEYAKVIEESVYDHLRVVREGQLRVIFTPDLKILSWEFCASRHEVLISRRSIAPQVNQLLQVAQKCQNVVSESGPAGASPHDLQTNCNMFVTAGRQLARNLELQSLNDLGFPKRFIRCLQISEVVNSMKDLIDFNSEHANGPIESLKMFPQHAATKLRNQKMESERLVNPESYPKDPKKLNELLTINPTPSVKLNRIQSVPNTLNSSQQGSTTSLKNYHVIMKQNSTNSNLSALQLDAVSDGNNAQLQGHALPNQVPLMNKSVNGLLTPQQQPPSFNFPQQNNHNHPGCQTNQHLQQHAIQHMLQEMMNNNRGMSQQSSSSSAGPIGTQIQFPDGPLMPDGAVSLMPNVGNNSTKFLSNNSIMRNNSFLKQEFPQNFPPKQEIQQDVQQTFQMKQWMSQSLQLKHGMPQNFQIKQEMPQNFQLKQEMPQNYLMKREMPPNFQLKQEMPQNFQMQQEMTQNRGSTDLIQDISDFADGLIFPDGQDIWDAV